MRNSAVFCLFSPACFLHHPQPRLFPNFPHQHCRLSACCCPNPPQLPPTDSSDTAVQEQSLQDLPQLIQGNNISHGAQNTMEQHKFWDYRICPNNLFGP